MASAHFDDLQLELVEPAPLPPEVAEQIPPLSSEDA